MLAIHYLYTNILLPCNTLPYIFIRLYKITFHSKLLLTQSPSLKKNTLRCYCLEYY